MIKKQIKLLKENRRASLEIIFDLDSRRRQTFKFVYLLRLTFLNIV
jgi:hypothetical protein